MSILTAANLSRAIGAGRIVVGLSLVAVPARAGASWIGEASAAPPTQVALRAMGIRDALIGMAQIHTAGDPARGYRWARTSAFADITDFAATVAASRDLPRSGVYGAGAVAAFAAVASLTASRLMRPA